MEISVGPRWGRVRISPDVFRSDCRISTTRVVCRFCIYRSTRVDLGVCCNWPRCCAVRAMHTGCRVVHYACTTRRRIPVRVTRHVVDTQRRASSIVDGRRREGAAEQNRLILLPRQLLLCKWICGCADQDRLWHRAADTKNAFRFPRREIGQGFELRELDSIDPSLLCRVETPRSNVYVTIFLC